MSLSPKAVVLVLSLCSSIWQVKGEAEDDQSPLVTLEQGKVRGILEKSIKGRDFSSFLGIPFAEPPVGKLRFMDPKPPKPWEGILEANKYPEFCLQYSLMAILKNENIKPIGKEDCLYLTVHTPTANYADARLPVMVFIYGGGFMRGGAQEYPPHVLMDEDVVLVVLQYRVTAFGFLSTGDSVLSGNFGLKDQTMALKWIQDNIAQFGGDKDRVTIFGESAGGASTHLLMLSPWTKGLFQRVIAQSGTGLCPWSNNRHQRENAKAFGDLVGCPLEEDSQHYLECLQGLDGETILNSTLGLYIWGANPLTMIPNVDGDFLPDEPAVLVKEKRYNKVDLMAGIVRDEGALLTLSISCDSSAMENLDTFLKRHNSYLQYFYLEQDPNAITTAVMDYYLNGQKPERNLFPQMNRMFGDRYFSQCYDVTTALHADDPGINVYRYELHHRGRFSFAEVFQIEEAEEWIVHVDELFYLFGGGGFLFKRPMTDENDLKMRTIMTKLWVNFATTGQPTPDASLGFTWRPTQPNAFRHLNITLEPQMADFSRSESFQFWLSLPLTENKFIPKKDSFDIFQKSQSKEEL